MSYLVELAKGLFARFYRTEAGRLECTGVATSDAQGKLCAVKDPESAPGLRPVPGLRMQEDDHRQPYAYPAGTYKVHEYDPTFKPAPGLTERAEEANLKSIRDEFLTPTTALDPVSDERLRAMDLDALRKLYRRAIDSGDSDLASRVTQQFYRAEHESEDK